MIVAGREVIWNGQFLTSTAAIQQYISESNPVRERTFASEVLDYTLEVIAPNPFADVYHTSRNIDGIVPEP